MNVFQIQILLMCLQATFKGWMDIMYAAVDSVDVSVGQHNTKSYKCANSLAQLSVFESIAPWNAWYVHSEELSTDSLVVLSAANPQNYKQTI